MTYLVKPVDIIVEFLRTVYKEPARTGLSKRHTTTSDTFTATASQTTFTVTHTKLLCVNSVTVNSVSKYKYSDYNIDLRNNQIILNTGATVGHSVVINYDYGDNSWINPVNSEKNVGGHLVRTDFPRITVSQINYSAQFLGFNSDVQMSDVTMQIDVATKDKLKATDYVRIKTDGTSETITETVLNQELIDVILLGIMNAIRRKWRSELSFKIFLPSDAFRSVTELKTDQDIDVFRKSMDIQLNGFNLGERA